MRKLIEFSLVRSRAITVAVLALMILGCLAVSRIPMDVLPVYPNPAVQTLTFYNGMPANEMANTITNRLERWTGTATGMRRQESRSIMGCSIIHNFFRADTDPNGALTQVNSLALGDIPNLPPGTLPPVVLPYDPTGTVPAVIVAVDSDTEGESVLYDVARYEARNMIMSSKGANAPVVFGGKVRTILAYLHPTELEARGLSPTDVMTALARFNPFIPTGDAKFGITDYAINSNAMYRVVEHMKDIPVRISADRIDYLGDVATPSDTDFIQTNIVRINGRREVYIPVFRQQGSSTLQVVDDLKKKLPEMEPRLSKPNIRLKPVMDQSVYVRQSIKSLITEGVLGAVLCSLVILFFLGQWRMTMIAVLTLPTAVLAGVACLLATGQTLNVMTLGGLALAIGPMVDSAIICLENTERHLREGASPHNAALNGAAEVAMPELVASCCTLLVLAPLALMPGMGQFLFRPMALAVAFAMIAAYLLSRSFVPSRAANWLKHHWGQEEEAFTSGPVGGFFDKVQAGIDAVLGWYKHRLDWVLGHRWLTVLMAGGLLALLLVLLGPHLRRDFFPQVDAGSFEIYVRADTGTRIEVTEKKIARVEKLIKETIGDDLELTLSEIGVWADWSAAYTPNTGPMDAVIKIQLKEDRQHSAQEYAQKLRTEFPRHKELADLEVAFNTGGMIRSALNEGAATPLNVRIQTKDLHKGHKLAEEIRRELEGIDGVVDARVLQKLDYPEYIIELDRSKVRLLGFTLEEVMQNVVAVLNSSIQFNKTIFWIDPQNKNQYYVGVQYPEKDIQSLQTVLNVSMTSRTQKQPIPLSNLVSVKAATIPALVTHTDLLSTIDLTMNVHGRDLGHVADDIVQVLGRYGQPAMEEHIWMPKWMPKSLRYSTKPSEWSPFDPDSSEQTPMKGASMKLSGEYEHMETTFANFGLGLALAVIFIYFLMVSLLDSYLIPLVVLSAVPVGLIGVVLMLFVTGTAINVQSLLGVIFMVGIVVSNTVLLTDFAQNLRTEKRLSPTEAVRQAARIRARPVLMTAVAALFALIPMALALERGSEANAPLGRAVIGGLIAGLFTTLFVVPAFYSLVVRDSQPAQDQPPQPARGAEPS